MPTITISLPTHILNGLDRERKWVGRSKAVAAVLDYALKQEGIIKKLCGADIDPPLSSN